MKLSEYFIQTHGAQALLARAMGIPAPMLSQWASGARQTPLERCTTIELATTRQVMRWDLRPNDWHHIWPELIGAEGAPPAPESIQEAKAA